MPRVRSRSACSVVTPGSTVITPAEAPAENAFRAVGSRRAPATRPADSPSMSVRADDPVHPLDDLQRTRSPHVVKVELHQRGGRAGPLQPPVPVCADDTFHAGACPRRHLPPTLEHRALATGPVAVDTSVSAAIRATAKGCGRGGAAAGPARPAVASPGFRPSGRPACWFDGIVATWPETADFLDPLRGPT